MDWRDDGVLLSTRRHGETGAILDVFTAEHGRHLGLLHGGASRKKAPWLQPGAQLSLQWRARLDAHLGTFRAEPIKGRAAGVFDDPIALAALSSACALLSAFLPERAPEPGLYPSTLELFDAFAAPERWPALYASWELALLDALGYGLDLETCAVTGASQELVWVSPKSGRAVSRAAGAPYADRLLPLPRALRLGEAGAPDDFAAALRLTGHFWSRRVAPAVGLDGAPPARRRLAALADRAAAEDPKP